MRCVPERTGAATAPLEVVAVNDVISPAALAHLLTYDSTYGRLNRPVEYDETSLTVDGHRIAVTAQRDPAALDWGGLGVDVVIESTGRFRTRDQAGLHLAAP
ncbi:glyceraldehyde 3-phosphate dehydrogenase NAD-binding domain-containing protein, partial [Streptomyces tendae]